MRRTVMARLEAWKASPDRKPLLLEGARQVGKTWLLKQFAQTYDHLAYVDFEQTPSLGSLFEGDLDARRLLSQLRAATGVSIEPGRTLIVFDEIQACPRALTALKYINEEANEFHVACAGSLLGVALHAGTSFPVGKVNFIGVDPLSFGEFLTAAGQQPLVDALATRDWSLLAPFHDRLVTWLRDYLFVGGMPAVVAAFVEARDYGRVRDAQEDILRAYDRDFSKHADPDQVPRIRAVWQSIPAQLAKEQHRFTYAQVAPSARARSHDGAIEWLVQAGVALRVSRVSAPRLPLARYIDDAAFKLYLVDVGLLGALAGLSPAAVVDGNRLFTEFRGALTEQYAAMQLHALLGRAPCYWTNGGGTAEVDFVVPHGDGVVPIEVKAARNLKSQSLRVYCGKYAPELAVRSSLAPYARHGQLVDLPLYALGFL